MGIEGKPRRGLDRSAEIEGDLEAFLGYCREVRVEYNASDNKIVGIGIKDPETWTWQTIRLEGQAELEFRKAGVDMLTDVIAQVAEPAFASATGIDDVVGVAMGIVAPETIMLKLVNAAVQGLAHHFGLGFAAATLGELAEQTLAPLIDLTDGQERALDTMRVLDVAYDLKADEVTASVGEFVRTEIASPATSLAEGISQQRLEEILSELESRHELRPVEPEIEQEPPMVEPEVEQEPPTVEPAIWDPWEW